MLHRYRSIDCLLRNRKRPATRRRAMTLLELMIVMTIMLMVVGALGGLTRTVQQGFEYSEGYGIATQHARVVLDRIAQNACQATANDQFPGCIVVAETVNSYRYPDTLVIWRPSGLPANPAGLPLYSELLIYCPNPNSPGQIVEMTAPSDTRTVPAVSDQSGWQSALTALKSASTTKIAVLSTLLRTCSTAASGGGASTMRGAARFETRLRPSDADWASYKAGSATWMNLPWVQGIYGSQAGLRQVWVRMELQFVPGVDWIESNAAAAQAIPFFGSAALYYNLSHP
jgi:prepilin-type N-terminal cleavage/methylation domain-containing protein